MRPSCVAARSKPDRHRGRLHAMLLALILPLISPVWAQVPRIETGKPVECVREPGAFSSNVWERAKSPMLRKYCDLVAMATSKLIGTPQSANAHTQSAASSQSAGKDA